jgi:hypothetical protein
MTYALPGASLLVLSSGDRPPFCAGCTRSPASGLASDVERPGDGFYDETMMRALHVTLCLAALPATASAHGVAGQRLFPTTFAVDDPFMNDELSLLAHSTEQKGEAGGSRVRTTSLGLGFSKRILPGFGLELDEQFQ